MPIRGDTWQTDAGPIPITGVQFSGSMPGGHGSASFEVPVANAYLAPHHTLREGAWIEIFDDAHELYEGEVFSIKPSVSGGQHKLSVDCGGLISVAGKRADVSAMWVHRGPEGWMRRSMYNVYGDNLDGSAKENPDGVLGILVAAGAATRQGTADISWFLNDLVTDDIISYLSYTAEWDVATDANSAWKWTLDVLVAQGGWGVSTHEEADTESNTTSAGTSGTYTPLSGDARGVRIILERTDAGASPPLTDKYIKFPVLDIFSRGRTTKPRIDEAMVDLATRTGLATSSLSESVGGMLDDLRVGNGTAKVTAAAGLDYIAKLHSAPFEWGFWDGKSFAVKPMALIPENDAKVIVVGGDLPGLDSWDVAEYDEDVPDYACVLFGNKDVPYLPEAWPRCMYRPSTPDDDADVKVEIVDFSGLILSDDTAAAAGDNIISQAGTTSTASRGGTMTIDGTDTVHVFTSSGSFVMAEGLSATADVLVVGGGGGAASGGGGAGGYLTSTQTVTGTMPVVVGAGGVGTVNGAPWTRPSAGESSSFGTSTALGGGIGSEAVGNGGTGGSGGGGGGGSIGTTHGAGTALQGSDGGDNAAYTALPYPAGGGGGQAAAGGNASAAAVAGAGGAGVNNDIVLTGTDVGYAGGGGGGLYGDGTPGTATHGGGAGNDSAGAGTNGTANTGGGGGGAGQGFKGGDGGSGIVVVRYPTPPAADIPPPRSLAKGTVVISGTVKNRQGTAIPAHHVRAGWWVQNTETGSTKPLYITGHSVDLAAKKNALTIGIDWMEREIGVRQAELLAIPPTVVPDPVTEDYNDPVTPDVPYEPEPYYDEPYVDPGSEPEPEPGGEVDPDNPWTEPVEPYIKPPYVPQPGDKDYDLHPGPFRHD